MVIKFYFDFFALTNSILHFLPAPPPLLFFLYLLLVIFPARTNITELTRDNGNIESNTKLDAIFTVDEVNDCHLYILSYYSSLGLFPSRHPIHSLTASLPLIPLFCPSPSIYHCFYQSISLSRIFLSLLLS